MFDDNQDPFSNMNSTPENLGRGVSRREQLDIDSDGKNLGQKREEKYQNNNNNQKSKFRKDKGYRHKPEGHSLLFTIIVIVTVVGLAVYLPSAYRAGSLSSPIRSLFASPEENLDSFFVSILQTDKTISDLDKPEIEKEATQVYDKNNIFQSEYLNTQVEPEYMVYIYTGIEELDAPFDKWVTEYEATEPKATEKETEESDDEESTPVNNKYKIYRLNLEQVEVTSEVFDYAETKPMMLIYNTPFRGEKVLDSVVKDPEQLDTIPTYMDEMVMKANENW